MAKKMEEKDEQRWANTNKTIIHTKYGYHNGQDLPCMRKLRDHVGDADYEMVQLWAAKELGDDDRDRLVIMVDLGAAEQLGGVEIAHHKGLDGHSDADVLLHAICDALLGAAALGDIVTHFIGILT